MKSLSYRSFVFTALLSLLPSLGFAITNGTETFTVPDQSLFAGVDVGASGYTVNNVQGWNFTLYSTTHDTISSMDIWDGTIGSGNGVAFYQTDSSNAVYFNAVKITPTDGSKFDLDSIGLNLQLWDGANIQDGQNVTLYGLDQNGSVISGATLTLAVNESQLITFDTSSNSNFDQISGLLFSPSSSSYVMSYGFVDNIAVSNVTAVPEPSGAIMAISAMGFMLMFTRKKR